MPPETRATDLKRIEDSIAAVSQDHSQKFELLVDMLKGQSLKLDQTIENQGGQIHDIRNMMGTMAQQLEFTLQKISQVPGSSSNSRERPHLHSARVDVRNKELREDRVATYKVHEPKHFFPTFNWGGVHKWLFKCTQYFKIEEVADSEKLQIASYYLDGVALYWHQNFLRSLRDQSIELKQLSALVKDHQSGEDYLLYSLQFIELEEDSKFHKPQFQGITDAFLHGLLKSYQDVFQEPKGLPSLRDHDHKIPLKAGSEAVNLRPYRYSRLQKDSLERMVTDVDTRRRVTAPLFVYLTKRVFFSIRGNEDFIGVAI